MKTVPALLIRGRGAAGNRHPRALSTLHPPLLQTDQHTRRGLPALIGDDAGDRGALRQANRHVLDRFTIPDSQGRPGPRRPFRAGYSTEIRACCSRQ